MVVVQICDSEKQDTKDIHIFFRIVTCTWNPQ